MSEDMFQWSHFFSEMDSLEKERKGVTLYFRFNGATSFQKWIVLADGAEDDLRAFVSMEPLLFRNG